MRYRFYREHKYLIHLLFELERLIAKSDFRIDDSILKIKTKLQAYAELLKGHGTHEEVAIHSLLRKKGSNVQTNIESEHQAHVAQFITLKKQLGIILTAKEELRLALGYEFYLAYRALLIDNLQHFHEEETLIMPELQRLYTDEELKSIDRETYHHMTPADMVQMLQELSPHMDPSDLEFFLADIEQAQPQKYLKVLEELN